MITLGMWWKVPMRKASQRKQEIREALESLLSWNDRLKNQDMIASTKSKVLWKEGYAPEN